MGSVGPPFYFFPKGGGVRPRRLLVRSSPATDQYVYNTSVKACCRFIVTIKYA